MRRERRATSTLSSMARMPRWFVKTSCRSAETSAAAASSPPAAPSAAARAPVTGVDPEFVALFIEEAREVIAGLVERVPVWEQNPAETDMLRDIRRGFHTLKGSGRMVGAQRIGEFSWSVESLLNRVLSQTLQRSPDIVEIVRDAVRVLPRLVDELEHRGAPAADVAGLMSRADALSGRESSGMPPPPEAPAAEATPIADERSPVTEMVDADDAEFGVEPPSDAALGERMDPVLRDIFRWALPAGS